MRLVASWSISSRLLEGDAVSTTLTGSSGSSLLTVNGMEPCALTRLTFSVGRILTECRVLTVVARLSVTAAAQSLRGFCHDDGEQGEQFGPGAAGQARRVVQDRGEVAERVLVLRAGS